MRKEFQFVVVLTFAAIAAGIATVAAPEYLPALKQHPAFFFWGGWGFTAALIAAAIAIAVHSERQETQLGHGHRMIALAGMILCGVGFFVCLGIYFWPVAMPNPPQAVAPAAAAASISVERGPTLEATRNSTINAAGATIPGDLPFQFAKADDHSLIDMPGLTVTKHPDGTMTVTPGDQPREFPPPNGEFSALSNDGLIFREKNFSNELRAFQDRFVAAQNEFHSQGKTDEDTFKSFFDPYGEEYQEKFSGAALSLASEFLARLGTATATSRSAQSGGGLTLHRAFAGPRPASDVADFLDALRLQLAARTRSASN